MTPRKWDARIRRAGELGGTNSFAAEGLRFYERVAEFQKSLYADALSELSAGNTSGLHSRLDPELDLFLLLPRFSSFLSRIEQIAPDPLAQYAREMREWDSHRRRETLSQFWRAWPAMPEHVPAEGLLISWLFLQPYAECLADHAGQPPPEGTPSNCPFCSGKPLVGVLRPEGDGAKRFLICALCSREWDFRRLVCPACGVEDVHKLAVYTAERFGHVRVEACDSCRRYLKTVDLTKDGNAVPVVDDLATTPLDLWATEHGYFRLQSTLLGI
jgi:FdhE protein